MTTNKLYLHIARDLYLIRRWLVEPPRGLELRSELLSLSTTLNHNHILTNPIRNHHYTINN